MPMYEKAYLTLDRPIPGIDHLKALDPEKLCDLIASTSSNFNAFDIKPLSTFLAGSRAKWFPAQEGLQTVRALIDLLRAKIAKGPDSRTPRSVEYLEAELLLLQKLEELLDKADVRDIRFYFRERA